MMIKERRKKLYDVNFWYEIFLLSFFFLCLRLVLLIEEEGEKNAVRVKNAWACLFGCLSRCCHWISVGSIVKLSVVTMNGFVVRSSITVEKCNRLIESECCEWYTFWLNYKNKVITIVSNRIGIDNQQKSISSQWKITSCRGVFIVWTTILESLNWLEV